MSDDRRGWASVETFTERFDLKVRVTGRDEWDGEEEFRVADLKFYSEGENDEFHFSVTLQEDHALEVAEEIVAAVEGDPDA